jgi:glycosyltransferase involved in cell wall biosynthesis
MRVAMIEPQCHGGICHYSHALCNALVQQGVDVTLLTGSRSELQDWPRQFRIANVLDGSQAKRALLRVVGPLLGRWDETGRRGDGATGRPDARQEVPPLSRFAPSHPLLPPRSGPALGGRNDPVAPSPKVLRARRAWLEAELFLTVRRLRANVVHLQWPVDWLDNGRFLRRLRRLGVRTVFTAHDVLPHDPGPGDAEAYSALYHSGARIILHSENNRDELLSRFAPDPARVHVVPMGSFGFLGEKMPSPPASRQQLGLPPHARVVLFFGLIRPYKGLEDLLRAFSLVAQTDGDAWLLVVGAPAGTPGPEHYRRLMADYGIVQRTRFLPEYLAPEAVGGVFAAADVVALPYRRASQSAVLQLAYACGKPVVGTNTGGLPEVIEQGRSGYVVEPGDILGLAGSIRALFADPEARDAMGRYAHQLSATKFAWSTIAATTREIYEGGARCAVRGARSDKGKG